MNKIKKTTVDFRRTGNKPNTIPILGVDVGMVENYRYSGVDLVNRLDSTRRDRAHSAS